MSFPELFLRNPEWHVAYDIDPVKAVQTRRRFYDMAAAERTLISGFHFSFPSMGYVEKDGTSYRLVPVRLGPGAVRFQTCASDTVAPTNG